MATRARIFEASALDTADFAPKTEAEERPNAKEIDQITGSKFFRSREVMSSHL